MGSQPARTDGSFCDIRRRTNADEVVGDGYRFPPCVGCGYCCIKMPCVKQFMAPDGSCTRLYWNERDQMYRCKEIEENRLFRLVMAPEGSGCCSPLNSWREDVRRRGI